MKLLRYSFLLSLVAMFWGCQSNNIDEEHHYTNHLYITSDAICSDLLIKDDVVESTRKIDYRIASPISNDVQMSFEAVPSMTAAYNLSYNDNAIALDEKYYEIPQKTATIKAGDVTGESVVINFKNTNELDSEHRYVLPVTISTASNIDILQSKRTVFYVFKGAALINVVANIRKIYFPIRWASDVSSLSTITVEALVRASDWEDGRDNALSSVFGIEGTFLVRIGDADRPRNQLQLVAPGGNFPNPNVAPGLPTNEWVHIAIVYDATTRERLYYQNGVLVASDNAASSSVNLSRGCYVGYSYDSTRWLPGEISELRIWSKQRSADEIANSAYYVDPKSEGLIAYWRFNEGTGSVIHDYTGHGNDITGSGEPAWINVELPEK